MRRPIIVVFVLPEWEGFSFFWKFCCCVACTTEVEGGSRISRNNELAFGYRGTNPTRWAPQTVQRSRMETEENGLYRELKRGGQKSLPRDKDSKWRNNKTIGGEHRW